MGFRIKVNEPTKLEKRYIITLKSDDGETRNKIFVDKKKDVTEAICKLVERHGL